ncbi:hypothetical protein J1614_005449 [Plenodomus biglobosus]|nr:hypothetical protein J1614_005449 [Plenodomus biglobosus]
MCGAPGQGTDGFDEWEFSQSPGGVERKFGRESARKVSSQEPHSRSINQASHLTPQHGHSLGNFRAAQHQEPRLNQAAKPLFVAVPCLAAPNPPHGYDHNLSNWATTRDKSQQMMPPNWHANVPTSRAIPRAAV